MKRDPEKPAGEMIFGGPHIAPGMSQDPIVLRTQQAMAGRGLIPPHEARGGGPTPPIPRLDMPATEGSTMADQAVHQRMPPPGSAVTAASSFIQPPARINGNGGTGNNGSRPSATPSFGILPSDTLPLAAQQDPAYQPGMGATYAASQPHLAQKYGVIRGGRHIPAQQLVGTKQGGLSQTTVEGLSAVAEFNKKREQAESPDSKIEAESAASSSGQAGRFNQPASESKPLTPEERKRLADKIDDFDFHAFREMMSKDIINNEEQKKLIEDRLQPMSIDAYVINGFVEQHVIINKSLSYTLRSITGETDLAIKRLASKEVADSGASADSRYILDKHSIMSVACHVQKINSTDLGTYQDASGHFNDDLFWEKFTRVVKLPLHLIASLAINSSWFDVRVRKLVTAENLGNG